MSIMGERGRFSHTDLVQCSVGFQNRYLLNVNYCCVTLRKTEEWRLNGVTIFSDGCDDDRQ